MCEWSLILFKLPEEIIVVNMDTDPGFKKMDTVVKLDSVSVIISVSQFKLFYEFSGTYSLFICSL